MNNVVLGDCLEVLKTLPDNSIDAIVTDPPYGLSFMGKKWDYDVPSVEVWKECLRVLKPGGYLLSFAGTRTQHRMAVKIEDAGFEIRDMIAWVYGSGFPKSLNIGKAVDKLQGNEREEVEGGQIASQLGGERMDGGKANPEYKYTKGTSEWEGWGTALKPALEPITVARKPIEGTVAENCLKWGVGGINIDESRISTEENRSRDNSKCKPDEFFGGKKRINQVIENSGRFPANLLHDGSDEVVELFPNTKTGNIKPYTSKDEGMFGMMKGKEHYNSHTGDSGSASRFFYCAKASKSERNNGCEELEEKKTKGSIGLNTVGGTPTNYTECRINKNHHPTVKPIALMEYLVKLVSKEGHLVLDPFAGSGSTLIACQNLRRNFIGIEREPDYIKIAEARLNNKQPNLI